MNKPTPFEIASLASALYIGDHKTGDTQDGLSITEYFKQAMDLIVSADEFIKAREREQQRPEPWQDRAALLT